jgi:hypothetical protein
MLYSLSVASLSFQFNRLLDICPQTYTATVQEFLIKLISWLHIYGLLVFFIN